MVAALDALGELDLLRGGEQIDLADVLQEELERVGRDLELDGHFLLVEDRGVVRLSTLVVCGRNVVLFHLVDFVEEWAGQVLGHARSPLLPPSAPKPRRMRNSCSPIGRMTRPYGSFL